ncbi:WD40-repeat-containing domain protein [Microdochium trichocladiopsis]|uniref:Pre-rRNA-processing protein IPI3 n=1 Tax=Microdochium trichocladiopsis TaxID=1682393 RepID=A0A9P9BXP2_9PEZI|nr:WD40-repeat-containing domain protein [Microdochium trichocladiopsis]KAH7037243.1 WD40-repeat-containing domain protein [Microdochium trichocladiopsis]
MITESYFASISGPPLANNTAIARDAGIYEHTLHPNHSTTAVLKKSSVPRNALAASPTHVFAAQDDKSTVHVYARPKGSQEAIVTFSERIRAVALQDDVLFLGTQEGRLIAWETCTGRQVSTPACHVQAISCIATTPFHIITGSDDSNLNVWALPRLLELGSTAEHEPERSLADHRAAITSVAVTTSINPDTSLCVSASKDKSCVIWNYTSGTALRTILLPSHPLCIALDPCARAVYASTEDGSLYAVELFDDKALIGPRSDEDSSMAVQVSAAFGAVSPTEVGPASCLAVSYDGTVLLSGHPRGQILRWDLSTRTDSTELANLNAAVTNLVFTPALPEAAGPGRRTAAATVVKPFMGSRTYNYTAQLESDMCEDEGQSPTAFSKMLTTKGLPRDFLEVGIMAFQQQQQQQPSTVIPESTAAGGSELEELRKENAALREVIAEQRALQKKTLEKYLGSQSK